MAITCTERFFNAHHFESSSRIKHWSVSQVSDCSFGRQKKPQRSAIKQVIISFVNRFGQLMNANEPNLKTKGGWKQMIDLNQRPK